MDQRRTGRKALNKRDSESSGEGGHSHTTIDTIPVLAWAANIDGFAEFFNKRWLDYTGLSCEEASGSGWSAAVHPEDRDRLLDKWRVILASGQSGEAEGRLRRYDGAYRWFLFRAEPLRDQNGQVVRWYGTNTDIEELKQAQSLLAAEKHALEMIADGASLNEILSHVCNSMDLHVAPSMTTILLMDSDGKRLWHTAGSRVPREWVPVISPLPVASDAGLCGTAAFLKKRIIVPDVATDPNWPDQLRPIAIRNGIRAGWSEPILTRDGQVLGTFALYAPEPRVPTDTDLSLIEGAGRVALIAIERRRSQEALSRALDKVRESEHKLRQIIDTIPGFVCTLSTAGEVELLNRQTLEYFGKTLEELKNWDTSDAVHPDDLPQVVEAWKHSVETGEHYEMEFRQRRADGVYRWFQSRALPTRDSEGRISGWYMLLTDIEDSKRAEDALRASEQSFRELVNGIPGFVFTATAGGEIEFVNRQILDYTGRTIEELKRWTTSDLVHPDDLPKLLDELKYSLETGQSHSVEHRVRGADGLYRWFVVRRLPQRDIKGCVVRWFLLLSDIDDRKRAEEALRSNEQSLREIVESIPGYVATLNPNGGLEFVNRQTLEYFGKSLEELKNWAASDAVHPEDLPRVIDAWSRAIESGQPLQSEHRSRRADGEYRWFHLQGIPQRDAGGRIVRWYQLVTDIDDRKHAEERLKRAFEEIRRLKDRLHDENIALREQIDQAFMFEEIVGSSPALKSVISSIKKVAPTDSTVLITGETGTGKEMVARAIHKSSQRAGQPFITVNLASIPPSLVASELFGHEKGAFTGALQQRRGRFELAHSGTIFLDEIGELPAETQVALLRLLQDRQFERVGGSRAIPTDVRIIAATNRDLGAAIVSGTFRADLFYRLNVFPIDVPPLRDRKEDIPMLIDYFVRRFADKIGKQIKKINKKTLKLCQSYHWPGNIRELQNIVERSVILCTGDTFWVEEAWFSSQADPRLERSSSLTRTVKNYEKELIEAALARSKGKVAGPNGAAVKLGIPRSTLALKIKQLKIRPHTNR
jgi:PAS domain S-box-containing protein